MKRTFLVGTTSTLALDAIAAPAFAGDWPLIWKPTKNSDTSYSVKLGLQLPTRIEAEAGISFGMNTTTGGAPVDTPIKLWSNFVAEKMKTPTSVMSRGIGMKLDGQTGSAAINMNYYEKQIATPSLDLERNSSYTMRYEGSSGEWSGIDANQTVRLSHGSTGTTLIGRASASSVFGTLGAGVGLEQQIGEYMTVTGSLDSDTTTSDPAASISARYSFTW